MEALADFMSDCSALSGSSFPGAIRGHEDLTRVLTSMVPRKSVSDTYTPLTSFGERVLGDLANKYSFIYNGINTCTDAEITLAESVELALKDGPKQDDRGDKVASGRRITIFTLSDVPVAIQKNIKTRTSYVFEANPEFNLISHTIAKFSASGLVYPPSAPNTVFRMPLEGSNGHFLYGRYATTAVDRDIREQLSTDTARTREGLMLDHDKLVAHVNQLLERAELLRMDIAA